MTDRRQFLQGGAALTAASWSRVLGANDRIRIGAIGTGGRCHYLLEILNKLGGIEQVAVCDAYEPNRMHAVAKVAPGAKDYVDYRELLDRKDIDAVVIGSPDHWHTPMTIDAVRAGKDVYVEKPVTHTIAEGERLIREVEESRRVVQVGYQQRSTPHMQDAKQVIDSGALGRITLVLTYWYQDHLREGAMDVETRLQRDKLDWKRWLGNAPTQPVDARRYFSWRWFWDFGGGAFTDLFSHWLDVAHWYMGADTPSRVQAMGERYVLPVFECPDTQSAYLEYPNFAVSYLGTLIGHHEGGGIILRGTKGMMRVHRGGWQLWPEVGHYTEAPSNIKPAQEGVTKVDHTPDHMRNFLECVRDRRTPNSPVATAVPSARAAHLCNLALRTGRTIRFPEDVPA